MLYCIHTGSPPPNSQMYIFQPFSALTPPIIFYLHLVAPLYNKFQGLLLLRSYADIPPYQRHRNQNLPRWWPGIKIPGAPETKEIYYSAGHHPLDRNNGEAPLLLLASSSDDVMEPGADSQRIRQRSVGSALHRDRNSQCDSTINQRGSCEDDKLQAGWISLKRRGILEPSVVVARDAENPPSPSDSTGSQPLLDRLWPVQRQPPIA